MKSKVIGAAIGQCVHVAGLDHFLQLCERNGWETISLGPAVPLPTLLAAVEEQSPAMVAISYRLTAEDAIPLFHALKEAAKWLSVPQPKWIFGGTPPVAEEARKSGLFDIVFDGTERPEQVESFLVGRDVMQTARNFPQDLVSRIRASYPMPLIRHHYGEPDLHRTIKGVRRIAKAEAVDVLSIGPDQNAQEHLFHPEEMDDHQNGAGGVPIRKAEDLAAIYRATRRGNFPLVRCYSGTRDLVRWADMSLKTIHNAWGAIPLCWYSVMDGRSKVPLPDAIQEKQEAIRFYAERDVPVEVNESHQWSLRDAHDALAVAMAFLAAYNARAQGVKYYIIQMMHNTPPATSPAMDLAKMLAKLELIGELKRPDFRTFREVRAGITSLPFDPDEAKGHMAASHVVDPKTLIESCRIARGAVRLALQGAPNPACDPAVLGRKRHLISEAKTLLDGIRALGPDSQDPWTDPEVLTQAIRRGVLDAPHFRGNPHLCGRIVTDCVNGGWEAIVPANREPMLERDRLKSLGVTL